MAAGRLRRAAGRARADDEQRRPYRRSVHRPDKRANDRPRHGCASTQHVGGSSTVHGSYRRQFRPGKQRVIRGGKRRREQLTFGDRASQLAYRRALGHRTCSGNCCRFGERPGCLCHGEVNGIPD